MEAADAIGVRVLLVHAKHERATAWYEQYGFEDSPTDPLHSMLLFEQLAPVTEGTGVNPGRKRGGRLVFGAATE